MTKKIHIYSTLSAPQVYQNWKEGAADLPVPVGPGVRIEGGANVAGKNLVTPRGVLTVVSEEDLAYLLQNRHFLEHEKNGFIRYEDARAGADADEKAATMESKDKSAPLTPDDFPAAAAGAKPEAKGKK